METITGDTYSVNFDPQTLTATVTGSLRLNGMDEYAPILDLLRKLLDGQPAPATLDVKGLEFLNSSGITMFSRFVIEARDRQVSDLLLVCSATIPWQGRSLKNLQRLMPSLRIDARA